ncbi:MAG: FG-GAP-like repeat-containing protein [Salinibacter sp.]
MSRLAGTFRFHGARVFVAAMVLVAAWGSGPSVQAQFSEEAQATASGQQPPAITSLQPKSGAAGTTVRIYGAGFDPNSSNNTVTFGSATATVDSAKSTAIYARVPNGISGPVEVSVTTGDTTVTATERFVVVTGGGSPFVDIDADLTGVRYGSSDWGDYDGDGDLDLVVTGSNGSNPTTTIYENEKGSFSPVSANLTGVTEGSSSQWGDFDDDGDLDLVVTGDDANDDPTATIYENEDGAFSPAGVNLTGVRRSSSDWGDFDGDGDLDLAVTGFDGSSRTATLYENEVNSFSPVGASLTGVLAGSSDWGDFDGDGDLDLVVTGGDGSNRTAKIYENEDGSFSPVGAGLIGVASGSSGWGDFDQDGDLDLIVTGREDGGNRTAIVYENEGGSFSPLGTGLTGVRLSSSDWGDFDADGDLDLVVTGHDGSSWTAVLYENEGSSFSPADVGLTGVSSGSSGWGDFDADGNLDLIVTGYDGGTPTAMIYENGADITAPAPPANLTADSFPDSTRLRWSPSEATDVARYRIYRDTAPIDSSADPGSYAPFDSTAAGDTTFVDTEVTPGQTYYYRVTAVDSSGNESGFSEQATARPPLAITGLQPESGAAGTQIRIYGAGFSSTASENEVTLGDKSAPVDSAKGNVIYARVPSGVIGPQEVSVAVGDTTVTSARRFMGVTGGSTSFAAIGADLAQIGYDASDWGDFDGGGDLDLAVAGGGGAAIYRNEGADTGTFSQIDAGLTGVNFSSVDWGDFEGDGDLDLVVTGTEDAVNPTAKIYENKGTETFAALGADLTGVTYGSAEWGDYDKDGDLDLVVTGKNSDANPTAKIYRNEGAGTFVPIGAGLTGVEDGSSADWGDFNGDGTLDLVVTGWNGSSRSATIYENKGGGTFAPIGAGLDGVTDGSSAHWGDFDGDADLDLVVTGGGGTRIYRNEGGKSFTPIDAGLTGVIGSSSDWGDFDGDSDLDLIVTGRDQNQDGNLTATIYENTGSGEFKPLRAGLAGVKNGSSSWGDYDGDGDLDLIVTDGNSSNGSATAIYENGGDSAPPPPTGMTASAGNQEVHLTWYKNAESDLAGYQLYRSTSSFTDTTSATRVGPDLLSDTTYTDTGLNNGTTYYYRVVAVDSSGNRSGASNEASATPESPPAITSLRPQSGSPGTTVRIRGAGFSLTASENTVTFGTVGATVDSARGTVIYARVPSGPSGLVEVSVTTGDTTVTATHQFTAVTGGGGPLDKIEAGLTGVAGDASTDWGDFDSDGDLDLVVTGHPSTATIYENTDGSFAPVEADLTGVRGSSVEWGDFDSDGDLDLLITGEANGSNPTAKIYENEDGASFDPIGAGLTGVARGSSSDWGDFDGDGDLDLVITGDKNGTESGGQTAMIYENEGGGEFTSIEAELTGVAGGSSSGWGDFDGDGDLDLVITGDKNGNDSGGQTATVYENEGAETFRKADAGLTGVWIGSSDWGDFDSDGDLDLVITGSSGPDRSAPTATIYENRGGGEFTEVEVGLAGVKGSSSDWGDFDGDGDLDLVITGDKTGTESGGQTTMIYENEGGESFESAQAGLIGVQSGSSSWGDYDGDGDLDLVVTGFDSGGTDTATIYENKGDAIVPTPPTGLTTSAGYQQVHLTWNESAESDLAGYHLYRSTSSFTDTTDATRVDTDLLSDTTYTDTGLTNGTTYYYRVVAVDASYNQSGISNEASATPTTTPSSPPSLSAAASTDRIQIQWRPSPSENVAGYEVFRAESSFTAPSQATLLTESLVPDTTFVDESSDFDPGTRYHYRVRSVTAVGTVGSLSEEVSVQLPPAEVQAETNVSFGNPGDADGYRLVALPGAISTDLGEVVPGEPGKKKDYRAFREEGAGGGQASTLQECGADCTFGPGTGFWLLHREDWSHQERYSTVQLSQKGTYEIPLTPGWNLISNPFANDLSWSAVTAANEDSLGSGASLGPIYRLSGGTWRTPETFASAQNGEAFYFNNDPGLETLVLPHPTARSSTAQSSSSTTESSAEGRLPDRSLVLQAFVGGEPESRVQLGRLPGAKEGLGPYDAEAPPSPFGGPTLRSVAESNAAESTVAKSNSASYLLRDYRPPSGKGTQFPLTLRRLGDRPVSIRTEGTGRLKAQRTALVDKATGRTFRLRREGPIVLRGKGRARKVVVLIGTASYVRTQKRKLAPEEAKLYPVYPNPVSPGAAATIEYAVPKARQVRIRIYDLLGRHVETLVRGRKRAGFHRVRWPGAAGLASGMYFVRLRLGSRTQVRKMTVIR